MKLNKKFENEETIYLKNNQIKNVYLTQHIQVEKSVENKITIPFIFPLGLIEKKLEISSKLTYKSQKETSYKILTFDEEEQFSHFFKSFEKFNMLFEEEKIKNIYYLEMCFLPETCKELYESVVNETYKQYNSYIEISLKTYTYDKYFNVLKSLAEYFMLFDLKKLYQERAYYNEGLTFFSIEKYEKALDILSKLTDKKDFKTPELFNTLSKCYYYKKDLKKAMENALIALKVDSQYYKAFHNLAVYYIKNHDVGNAQECWEKALKLKPDFEKAKKNLSVISKKFN
ncbi:MAG: tetratricopeptide repeat protein [Candidatus Muiribacteriota bacterium]